MLNIDQEMRVIVEFSMEWFLPPVIVSEMINEHDLDHEQSQH